MRYYYLLLPLFFFKLAVASNNIVDNSSAEADCYVTICCSCISQRADCRESVKSNNDASDNELFDHLNPPIDPPIDTNRPLISNILQVSPRTPLLMSNYAKPSNDKVE